MFGGDSASATVTEWCGFDKTKWDCDYLCVCVYHDKVGTSLSCPAGSRSPRAVPASSTYVESCSRYARAYVASSRCARAHVETFAHLHTPSHLTHPLQHVWRLVKFLFWEVVNRFPEPSGSFLFREGSGKVSRSPSFHHSLEVCKTCFASKTCSEEESVDILDKKLGTAKTHFSSGL
jgi:hypothetical protein